MIRVGVIGGGVVGGAHARVFGHYCDVKVYDVVPERATHSLEEVAAQNLVFVCLPTPCNRAGSVPTDAIEDVLRKVMAVHANAVVILKSTLPPAALYLLEQELTGLRLIFSPEFLTERSAEYDLQQSTRLIFGMDRADEDARKQVANLHHMRFPLVPQMWTSLGAASLAKYATNVFFASKVALMNEIAEVAQSYGEEPRAVIDLLMMDPRIGRSHFQVPGHDGQLGFGGACFLKDMAAWSELANAQDVDALISRAAWKSNLRRRGDTNVALELCKLVGRAVTAPVSVADVHQMVR